jgi:hypothetical protein
MFDQLFYYPRVLARHQNAPMLIEREQFLRHCAAQGMARTTLTSLATELSVVAQRLAISGDDGPIGHQQIAVAAERWARYQRRRGRSRGLRWPRERFVQVARDWLGFLRCKSVSRNQLPAPSGLSSSPLTCRRSGDCPLLRFTTVAGIRRSSSNGLRHRTVRWLTLRSGMSIAFWSPWGSGAGAVSPWLKGPGRCALFFATPSSAGGARQVLRRAL